MLVSLGCLEENRKYEANITKDGRKANDGGGVDTDAAERKAVESRNSRLCDRPLEICGRPRRAKASERERETE